MKTAGYKKESRRRGQKGRKEKERARSHFDTVRSGGFDEPQIICYLWEIVKTMEAVEPGNGKLSSLKNQLRGRIRVEMRRYFARRKRRSVRTILCILLTAAGLAGVSGFVIGVDRVSGESMYPYFNNGDWIVYSRIGRRYEMNEVVVFERNGENYVKRIAGRPGDTVEISLSGGRVVVNGEQMRESYVTLTSPVADHGGAGDSDRLGEPLTIMDGQYLVLGDNRNVSIDSRSRDMGTVSEEEILGHVILSIRIDQVHG